MRCISRDCAGLEYGMYCDNIMSNNIKLFLKCNVIDDGMEGSELGRNSRWEGRNSMKPKERVLSLTSPAGFAPRPV